MKRFTIKGGKNLPGQIFTITVDDQDAYLLRTYVWRAQLKDGYAYFVRSTAGHTTVALHRMIMDARKGETVMFQSDDHLDLRRANLIKLTEADALQRTIAFAVDCSRVYHAMGV